MTKWFNGYTHNLHPPQKGDTVQIENQLKQWIKVIKILPDCHNQIRVDRSGLLLGTTVSWGNKPKFQNKTNFKPCSLPYQMHCLSRQALPVMFLSCILVMTPTQQLDTLWEALTWHYALEYTKHTPLRISWTYLDYSCITLQACLSLVGSCLHAEDEEMKEQERIISLS